MLDRLAHLDRPAENDVGIAEALLRPLPQETAEHWRLDMDERIEADWARTLEGVRAATAAFQARVEELEAQLDGSMPAMAKETWDALEARVKAS